MSARREDPPPSAARRRFARPVAAVAAGALPALAFPAPALWWLAWVGLVPWMLLVRSASTARRAAGTGWLGGTAFMLAVHHWLLPSLHVFLFVLAALLGLLWAPWGWLVRRLLGGRITPGRLAAALVLVPSGWLAIELVRSWEYLGGPWGLLGASQWEFSAGLRLASTGGVWLVTFVLVAVNTAFTALTVSPADRLTARGPRARGPRRAAQGAVASAAALAVCCGGTAASWAWAPQPDRDGRLRVAVVQPGVIKGQHARLKRSEKLTRGLRGRELDLVVWGESSVSFDLGAHPRLRKRLAELSAQVGAPILVNVDARRSDRPGIYKSSILIGPGGLVGKRYDKTRLVPFGEYVPARSLLGWATSVGRAADEDRLRGDGPVMMSASGERFGPLVCFESAFPDMSRELALDGARLTIVQSSTSTFQDSWAPAQHASLAALRAAETGRPMVHATLTGISAVYGPRGERVGPWLGTDRSAAHVYEVPLGSGSRTLYLDGGDWIVHGATAALVLSGAVWGVRGIRRRRGAHGRTEGGSSAPGG